MAISYKDVYKSSEFVTRVNDINNELLKEQSETSGIIFTAKSQIRDQINQLKIKEQQIFNIFGVKDVEKLNERINDFKNATINFNGPALYSKFIGILEAENAKKFKAFEEAVNEIINEEILNGQQIQENIIEASRKLVLNYLSTKNRRFTSSSGMTKVQFFPNSFTKEQKNRWEEILKKKIKEKKQSNSLKGALANWNIIINGGDTSEKIVFTWFDKDGGTNGLTRTQAMEKYPNINDPELQKINNQIKNYILEQVNNDYNIIRDIIDNEILAQDPYAFFIGKNTKDITGLLGEIQGLYYLIKLLGYENYFSTHIKWKGGLIGNEGVKPHQDIVIKSLIGEFGVQIKNTTSEYEAKKEMGILDINFANAKISTMFEKMQSISGISNDTMNLLETFYGTLGFNIPYHYKTQRGKKGEKNKKIAIPGLKENTKSSEWNKATSEYKGAREKLEKLNFDIDKLMSIFTAAFMYLDIFDYGKGGDFNSLFLIGGAAFITASHILETVLEDLENQEKQSHFSIKLDMSNDRNIITAINSGEREKDYSDFVIDDIKLISSFKF